MMTKSFSSEGGYIWVCKNSDAKILANFVAQGFGSLGLMTSVIETKDKTTLCETVHGTLAEHT